MKSVIVTGAAGFAGCNLVEMLMKKDYFVYAVVRPDSAHNFRLLESNRLKIIECRMQDYNELHRYIEGPCDALYHLAWQAGGFKEQKQCIAFSIEALKAAKRIGCKRFIGAGTQAEYGPQKGLITENICPNPTTAYGASKLAACVLTRQLANDLEIEWVWGRIFSLYGKYEPYGRMLPDLIKALKRDDEFHLSAATQNWDYLYSSDGAEALIALGEKGKDGEIYNVANGDFHPLKYFTEEIRKLIAPNGNLLYGEEVVNATSLQVSVDKIYKDTGWRAQIEFKKGIAMTNKYLSDIEKV
ncbi:Nucleoside-diphosphate-sugar epimerase [Selenomonas ruminantium]|uniref:Nucleoside-diphosphate-sugar epimerase n=1 Tax=Selenomonas ruminantium TaxID=971 RepID=A0A1I3CPW7_SELRU|nr:NAD(P)-dependent oxidoreductase [Selenomonas ruminantium]SFH76376.1 Nucleoside-diphosphate-sugar epimerase [Selenomonas ruminantium]